MVRWILKTLFFGIVAGMCVCVWLTVVTNYTTLHNIYSYENKPWFVTAFYCLHRRRRVYISIWPVCVCLFGVIPKFTIEIKLSKTNAQHCKCFKFNIYIGARKHIIICWGKWRTFGKIGNLSVCSLFCYIRWPDGSPKQPRAKYTQ